MKTLGIIGGMGPMASCDLLKKVIENTDAACDNAHIHVILDSNTNIPDRTAAILHGGPSPREELRCSAQRLENAGAEVLAVACNTAHYFYDCIAESVKIPVLHMPKLTAQATHGRYERVALLATDGMVQSGIYQKAFAQGPGLLLPEPEEQAAVMSLIYNGVKKGDLAYPTDRVRAALDALSKRGAQAFVLGCTELPIAFTLYDLPGATIDPTLILAREAVRCCGAPLRGN